MPYSQDDLQKLKLIEKKDQKTSKHSENPPGFIDANQIVQVRSDYWLTSGGKKAEPEKKTLIVTDSLLSNLPSSLSRDRANCSAAQRFRPAMQSLNKLFADGFKIYFWCGELKECMSSDDIVDFCDNIQPIHPNDVFQKAASVPLKRDYIAIIDYFKINHLCAFKEGSTPDFTKNQIATADFSHLSEKQIKKILDTFPQDLPVNIQITGNSKHFSLFSERFKIISCEADNKQFDLKEIPTENLSSLKIVETNDSFSEFLDKKELSSLKKLDVGYNSSVSTFKTFPQNAKNIEEINFFFGIVYFNNPDPCELKQLKTLEISTARIDGMKQLASLFANAPSLKKISLGVLIKDEDIVEPVYLPSLQEVHLKGSSYHLNEKLLQFFVAKNPSITHLSLINFHLNEVSFFQYNLVSLERLSLKQTEISQDFWKRFFPHSNQLHTLSLQDVTLKEGIPERFLLEVMTVKIENNELKDIPQILASTPNVSDLFIGSRITQSPLMNFPPLSHLKRLTLVADSITGEQLAEIIHNAPNLEFLDLSNLKDIKGELPRCNLAHLKEIKFHDYLSVEKTINLLTNARRLTELTVSSKSIIDSLDKLDDCHLESLKKVTVKDGARNYLYNGIDAKLLFKIIGQSHHLEELEIDVPLKNDLPPCDFPHLKKLTLPNVTLKYVAALCANATSLENLDLKSIDFNFTDLISSCNLYSLKSITLQNEHYSTVIIQAHQIKSLIGNSHHLITANLANITIAGDLGLLYLPKLQELNLSYPYEQKQNQAIHAQSLFNFISSCKQLHRLDLSNREIVGDLPPCNLPELTSLSVSPKTTATQLCSLVKNAQKLETLSVMGFTNFTGKTSSCKLSSLKKLYANHSNISAKQIEDFLCNSNQIEEISLASCKLLNGKWSLPKMPLLKKIDFSYANLNANQLSELFKKASNLEQILLHGYESKEFFKVGSLKKLRVLYLNGAKITVKQLHEILKNCPNLEELSLTNFQFLDSQKLPPLNFPYLKKMDISRSNITAEQLGSIIQKSYSLESLTLNKCKNFSGEFPLCAFPALKTLSLQEAEINASQLGNIINSAYQLTKLDLRNLQRLDGQMPRCMLHSLVEFDASGSNINAAQLTHIICEAIHLNELDLNNCKNLHAYNTLYTPIGCQLSSLKKIVAYESSITAALLAALLFDTPGLTELNLHSCARLAGDLPKCSLPHLVTLNLNNSKFTSSQITNLIADSRLLEGLAIKTIEGKKLDIPVVCRLLNLEKFQLGCGPYDMGAYSATKITVGVETLANLLSASENLQILYLFKVVIEGESKKFLNTHFLKSVSLQDCRVDASILDDILQNSLVKLDLCNSVIKGEFTSEKINLKKLQSLEISNVKTTQKNIENILRQATSIQNLHLSGFLENYFPCGPYPVLTQLTLGTATINGRLLAALLDGSSVKKLTINETTITDKFPICHLPFVQELNLQKRIYFSNENFLNPLLQSMPNLRTLNLIDQKISGTLPIGLKLEQLDTIHLTGSDISQESMSILLNSTPKILHISLSTLSQLQVLLQFPLTCLNSLTLPKTINMTELLQVIQKIPTLIFLDIKDHSLTREQMTTLKSHNSKLRITGGNPLWLDTHHNGYSYPGSSNPLPYVPIPKSTAVPPSSLNTIPFNALEWLANQQKLVLPTPDHSKLQVLPEERSSYIPVESSPNPTQNVINRNDQVIDSSRMEVPLSDNIIFISKPDERLTQTVLSSQSDKIALYRPPVKKPTFIQRADFPIRSPMLQTLDTESFGPPVEDTSEVNKPNPVHLSFYSMNDHKLVDPTLYRQVSGKDKYLYESAMKKGKNTLTITDIDFDGSIDDLTILPCLLEAYAKVSKKSHKNSSDNIYVGATPFTLTAEWQLLPAFVGTEVMLAVQTTPEVEFETGYCKENRCGYIRLLNSNEEVPVNLQVIVQGTIAQPILLSNETEENYDNLLMKLLLQQAIPEIDTGRWQKLTGLAKDSLSIIERAYHIQRFLQSLEDLLKKLNLKKDKMIPPFIKQWLLNDKLNAHEKNALIFSLLARGLHIPNYAIMANEAGYAFIDLWDEAEKQHTLSLGTEMLQFELVEDNVIEAKPEESVVDALLSPSMSQPMLPYDPLYVTWEQPDARKTDYLENYVEWLLEKGDKLDPGKQQILIYCPNKKAIEQLHEAFLSVLRNKGEECLYVRKLSTIRAKGVRFENGSFDDEQDSYFQTYVEEPKRVENIENIRRKLLLDWSYYQPSDVNKHSIVEKGHRRFNNRDISKSLVIFNFQLADNEQKLREDFTSRMGMITQHPDMPLQYPLVPENIVQETKINLYESPMWQMLLLGKVQINGEFFQLYDGGLLTAINEKKTGITLTNPPFHLAEFRAFWRQLMIDRTFLWNNELKHLPKDFAVTVNNEAYNLTDLAQAQPYGEATKYEETLNSQNSYRFYQSYHIDTVKKQLTTQDGILKKYSNRTLSLLVTESLSESEWARFLDAAKVVNCQLKITVAQGIQLPASCEFLPGSAELLPLPAGIQLLTSNDLGFSDAVLKEQNKKIALTLPTNSLTLYNELIESISFSKKDKAFSFDHKLSRIMEVLLDKEKKFRNAHLLIKGELSPELAQALSTLFASPKPFLWVNGEKRYVQNRVTFLLKNNPFTWVESTSQFVSQEDIQQRLLKEFPQSAKIILEKVKTIPENFNTNFSYLRLRNIILAYEANPEKNPFSAFFRLHPQSKQLLPEIKKLWPAREKKQDIPEDVLEQRLEKTVRTFKSSPYIFWVGETGTGKTTAFEKLKDYYKARGITVVPFYGLAEETDWADYKLKDNEMPIILYDEANMSENGTFDRYESMFTQKKSSGLRNKEEANPILSLKNGKIRKLSPRHKVFCAGNFTFYADRNQQDFFDDYGHIHCFKPYPNNYLRDGFLLPIFSQLHALLAKKQMDMRGALELSDENYSSRQAFPNVPELSESELIDEQRDLFNPAMQVLINVYLFAKRCCAGTNMHLTTRNLQMMAMRLAVLCEKVMVSDKTTLETMALFAAYDEVAGFLNKEQTQKFCAKFNFGGPRTERVRTAFYKSLSGVTLKEDGSPQLPATSKFYMTKSRTETWRLLRQQYDISRLRKEFPALQRCGTQGVFIEGGSGIGKTAIIQYLVEQQGVTQLKPDTIRQKGKIYFRDLSGTDLERIKEQLIDAHNQGDIVILDEIDTLPIEETLNSLPELEVYATGNGSAFSGRLILTPAFRNRYRCITLEDYPKGERAEIVEHFGNAIPGRTPIELENAFFKTKKYAETNHLRPEPLSRDFFDRTMKKNR